LILSCKENLGTNVLLSKFIEIECSAEELPKFDGNKVKILDENLNLVKDTILEQIEKRRDVFKPCREMIYRAIWKDKAGIEITNSRIKMMATGSRWDGQPEMQDEILIQFEYSGNDIIQTKKHQLNKGILDQSWMEQGIEGVIENVEQVWMHPFRFNQFNFTEIAPFPEIRFPLSVGNTWTGNLKILDGWGDWANTTGYFEYEVISRDTIQTNYGLIENCWHIKSKSSYPFGNSNFEFWFHESLGFVKKEYQNYGGQTLSIELEEVRDKVM
jgi:hypothetical protein